MQPNDDPEYSGAHEKRKQRIQRCFDIFETWKKQQSQQANQQKPFYFLTVISVSNAFSELSRM